MRITLLLFATLALPSTAGEVYKCRAADGSVTFTNMKCPDKADVQHYGSYRPVKDDPRQYRDALENQRAREEQSALAAETIPVSEEGVDVTAGHRSASPYGTAPGATPPLKTDTRPFGISKYQRGEIRGIECTRANGTVYYTSEGCGTSVVKDSRDDHAIPSGPVQTIDGQVLPHAHWVSPNTAVDAMTGQVIHAHQLQRPADSSNRRVVRDTAKEVDVGVACEGAKAEANRIRSTGADFDTMRKVDDRVYALCRAGRSQYDPRG